MGSAANLVVVSPFACRYTSGSQAGHGVLVKSETFSLKLVKGMPASEALSEAMPVVARLLHIMKDQMKAIDELDTESLKKQKVA